MMRANVKIAGLALQLCLAAAQAANAAAALSQPPEERAAQAKLPHAQSPVWTKFLASKVRFDDRSGLYSIALTPDVRALAGKPVTVNGFVLPLDASDHTRHFLLTRNTPVCMFCPPGEPNEVVEVVAPHPILWTDKLVTVTGPLSLVNEGDKGIFFKINATAAR